MIYATIILGCKKKVITDHGVIHKLARLAHTQDDLLRYLHLVFSDVLIMVIRKTPQGEAGGGDKQLL